MFKDILSFNGRIRRTEFGLIYLLYLLCLLTIGIISQSGNEMAGLLILFPFYLLIVAGIKRCHDRGNSGWWMIIPFYGFVMLFGDSDYGPNEYGDNPKRQGNEPFIDPFAPQYDKVKDVFAEEAPTDNYLNQ
ncbi:DUF805 domain-containing protein [Nubsella zeaxanthinifaciens]|uniref:DUF805 domain-containing protein n=1 Tax=Nubsella zeaxanthinifaciens TaxID=392412 RepID=UPI003D07D75E